MMFTLMGRPIGPFRIIFPAANKVEWCMLGSAFDASLLSTCMSPAMNRRDLDLCPAHSMLCFGSEALTTKSWDMQSLGKD
jgi:hypothetical protein